MSHHRALIKVSTRPLLPTSTRTSFLQLSPSKQRNPYAAPWRSLAISRNSSPASTSTVLRTLKLRQLPRLGSSLTTSCGLTSDPIWRLHFTWHRLVCNRRASLELILPFVLYAPPRLSWSISLQLFLCANENSLVVLPYLFVLCPILWLPMVKRWLTRLNSPSSVEGKMVHKILASQCKPAQQGCTPSSAGSHLSGGDPVLHNDRTRPLFTEILHDLSYLDIPLLVLFDPPPSLPQAAKVRALGQQPTLTAQRDL